MDLGTSNASGDRWTIEIEPDENAHGSANFLIRVTDGVGDHTDRAIQLTVTPVNDPPVADAGHFSCDEDSVLAGTLTAGDIDSATLIFVIDSYPSNGMLTLSDPSAGAFVYTPDPDFFGSDMIAFHASDGDRNSNVANVEITVNPINDPPVFTKGQDQTVSEDGGSQRIEGWAAGISPGPNEYAQILEFRLSGDPDIFKTGPTIDPETGDLTFETETDAFGTSVVTVQLTDSGGTGNGGMNAGDPASFVITVISLNDPPVFTKGPDIPVGINSGRHEISGWATDIGPGGEGESEQNLLGFTVDVDFPSLFTELPTIDTAGSLSFAVADDVSGYATVSVMLRDDGGTENGGVDTSEPQTFVIAVNPPPDPPVAIFPPPGHMFLQNPVTLQASLFSDYEGDEHIETHWLIKKETSDREQRIKYGCAHGQFDEYVDDTNTSADLTRHVFEDLEPGYAYVWKVGYKDAGSAIVSWSAEYGFKMGMSAKDSIHVNSATDQTDFRMISFVQRPDDPASASIFSFAYDASDSVNYDTKRFRIATFAPESGIQSAYVECGRDMRVQPGRAYWFYSKADIDIFVSGPEVSVEHDIEVELVYDENSDTRWRGWNMIACPNNAAYDWNELEVVVYDSACKLLFEGKTFEADEFVSPVFWKYNKGYSYYSPLGPLNETPGNYDPNPTLAPYQGYWVRVLRETVFLRFPVSAQTNEIIQPDNEMIDKGRSKGNTVRISTDGLADSPPPPVGQNGGWQNEVTVEDHVDYCFVSSLLFH